ncbi:MAG: nitrite/sulfite reductase [Bacteroidota bacterium]
MQLQLDQTKIAAADQADIDELSRRIKAYNTGKEDEDRFKHYRLTRGVYGQRQFGVQMFRTKIPYGRLTSDQLVRLADISEQYTNGNLHITTRQNIQLHHVKLNDSPAIWEALAEGGLTAREACGNTVRNITGSEKAGIDPAEPFDIAPYAHATFEYFLRNPICQEMGRKIKPAFSSSETDSAFTYFHDFGFIPRIREVDGKEMRGFKVVIAGGLGAVSMVAPTVYEFLPTDEILPFMESCVRVFDRYGEREKRMKARMKFLVKKLGLEGFLELAAQERKALPHQRIPIDASAWDSRTIVLPPEVTQAAPAKSNALKYEQWLRTNVFEQKQKGFFGVYLSIPLGDIHAKKARKLAAIVKQWAADDLRLTIAQGMLLRFVRKAALPFLFEALEPLGLAEPGVNSVADITACPGTDTCALGVTNSTGLSATLSNLIESNYPELLENTDLKIKISGCMNSCGQHMAANIGFHGSSIKRNDQVIPAMQVVIGGGVDPTGKGFVAQKVIKLPTKRIPQAVETILDDYLPHTAQYPYFNDYFQEQGKRYFYNLLKGLADINSITTAELQDWGQQEAYVQEIGVGECAGVSLDLISTILNDAKEKLVKAHLALAQQSFAESIYYTYLTYIIGAKALLLGADVKCNTHRKILDDFQAHFVDTKLFNLATAFPDLVLQINQQAPTALFNEQYLTSAKAFLELVFAYRKSTLGEDKLVIENYYKA